MIVAAESNGRTLEDVALDIATVIATAFSNCETVLVGPFSVLADEETAFGLHLAFAPQHASGPPRVHFLSCIPAAIDMSKHTVRRGFHAAIVTALCAKFRRVQACASLTDLLAAAGVSVYPPSTMIH
jgi:hypothetical protein